MQQSSNHHSRIIRGNPRANVRGLLTCTGRNLFHLLSTRASMGWAILLRSKKFSRFVSLCNVSISIHGYPRNSHGKISIGSSSAPRSAKHFPARRDRIYTRACVTFGPPEIGSAVSHGLGGSVGKGAGVDWQGLFDIRSMMWWLRIEFPFMVGGCLWFAGVVLWYIFRLCVLILLSRWVAGSIVFAGSVSRRERVVGSQVAEARILVPIGFCLVL